MLNKYQDATVSHSYLWPFQGEKAQWAKTNVLISQNKNISVSELIYISDMRGRAKSLTCNDQAIFIMLLRRPEGFGDVLSLQILAELQWELLEGIKEEDTHCRHCIEIFPDNNSHF